MNKISIQIGRGSLNLFTYSYDKSDRSSVQDMIHAYSVFYQRYRETHTISARMWNYPIVYIDGEPKYKVTPNGNWDNFTETV